MFSRNNTIMINFFINFYIDFYYYDYYYFSIIQDLRINLYFILFNILINIIFLNCRWIYICSYSLIIEYIYFLACRGFIRRRRSNSGIPIC